jgi:hypothetical protein
MDGLYYLDDGDHIVKVVRYRSLLGINSLYQIIWEPHFYNTVEDKTIYFGWELENKINLGLLRPVSFIKHNMTKHSFS